MFGSVMRQVATLAERCEVALAVVGRIVVEVCAGEHYPGDWKRRLSCKLHHAQLLGQAIRRRRPAQPPATIVAPAPACLVVPATIAKVPDLHAMRPAAMLALPLSTLKPDKGRQLTPVDRV